ncbi:MAG: hypothetical protein RLY78_74, partial [Pseudomonadota bacterium]
EHGCQAGLVLNPGTPLGWLDDLLDDVDLVMLMAVNPGFGGQRFIASTLPRLRAVRTRLDAHARATGRRIRLEVDGGVKPDNAGAIVAAGADTLVAGSAVFGSSDRRAAIAALRAAAAT